MEAHHPTLHHPRHPMKILKSSSVISVLDVVPSSFQLQAVQADQPVSNHSTGEQAMVVSKAHTQQKLHISEQFATET